MILCIRPRRVWPLAAVTTFMWLSPALVVHTILWAALLNYMGRRATGSLFASGLDNPQYLAVQSAAAYGQLNSSRSLQFLRWPSPAWAFSWSAAGYGHAGLDGPPDSSRSRMIPIDSNQDKNMNSSSRTAADSAHPDFPGADTGYAPAGLGHSPDPSSMNVAVADPNQQTIRLLVAIASFGEKNLGFLKRIIRNYQDMQMAVEVVVFSDKPKNLGRDVKVMVGLPSKNPWSLPFAHKDLLCPKHRSLRLFIYSEDDMAVTEKNIRAFLRVTPELKPEEIAGFLRYEVNGIGRLVPSGSAWPVPLEAGFRRNEGEATPSPSFRTNMRPFIS